MFICIQKINFISNFFLRYRKDIANLLLWELWERLTITIKNHSIDSQDTFMLISMEQINFITHCFTLTRYYKEIEDNESHLHFLFHCKLFLKLPYISKLLNLNYFFKINIKTIIIGYIRISQYHTFEDSPYFYISVSQAYYMLLKEILL